MMHARLITTILASALISTSVVARTGDAVRIPLANGTTWRGETERIVDVTYRRGPVEMTATGRLLKVEDRYLVVTTNLGDLTIILSDVVAVADASMDEATLKDRERDTRAPRRSGSTSQPSSVAGSAFDPDAPGVLLLPLSGEVGIEFRAEEIEAFTEEVDRFGPGQLVVLHIDSPGGLLAEVEGIHSAVATLRQNHRVVAWVEQALSAACAVAVMCDEVYFMQEGTIGAATATVGGSAAPQPILDRWRDLMGDWMEESGRPRVIANAMVERENVLSYSRDAETGETRWFGDGAGTWVLSGEGENLTLNASVAVHSGFAQGIADTPEEFAALLDLPRWNEKSDYGRQLHASWHRTIDRAKKEIPKLGPRIGIVSSSNDRIRNLTQTIKVQKQALRWWKTVPEIAVQFLPSEQTIEAGMENNQFTLAQLREAQRDRDRDGRGGR